MGGSSVSGSAIDSVLSDSTSDSTLDSESSSLGGVARICTYRIIFALAALEQWEIHGMDVITAFLLGKLDEEIYMMQPEGFERQGMKTKMVCRLLRSLYGLKQASRVWNIQLHEFLIKIGFRRFNADTCLYVNDDLNIVIAIWVDDILIAGKSAVNIAKVKRQLAGEFSMKDLSPISHFLGICVTRTNGNVRSTNRRILTTSSPDLEWKIQKRFLHLWRRAPN